MQSWEKERQISKDSHPGSPIVAATNRNVPPQDLIKSNLPPEFMKKYEQWQEIKDRPNLAAMQQNLAAASSNSQLNLSHQAQLKECPGKNSNPTSPGSEKKIRARPLAQPTLQVN